MDSTNATHAITSVDTINTSPLLKPIRTRDPKGPKDSGAVIGSAHRGKRRAQARPGAFCLPGALGLGLMWAMLQPGASAAVEFNTLQPAQSTLLFDYRQMNVPMEGRFKTFTVQLHFDPAKPTQGKAVLDAAIASLDTGSDEANDEVGGASWFNSKKYPVAHFESATIQALGGNRYEVTGALTIKGHTHVVSTPATVTMQGNRAIFDGSFGIKRADYAVGEGTWADFGTVANEIQIRFHLVTTP